MYSIGNSGNQREQSFPLISLIQLFTFFVALLVCIDASQLWERFTNMEIDATSLSISVVLAGMFGSLIGTSIGLSQIRNWRSMFFCGVIGSVFGIIILAIYAAPARPNQAIAAALLPLFTTLIIRVRAS